MRYYSEDTVRDIIKGVAQALEQSGNYADVILQNHQSIEIREPHGRCVDADAIVSKCEFWSMSRGDKYFELRISNEIVKAFLKDAPTVLEASNQQCEKKMIAGNQQYVYWCLIKSTFCEYATSKGYCSITACCKK